MPLVMCVMALCAINVSNLKLLMYNDSWCMQMQIYFTSRMFQELLNEREAVIRDHTIRENVYLECMNVLENKGAMSYLNNFPA